MELRPAQRQVLVDGQVANLGARAFDLLCLLVEQRHRVVSKNELIDTVWANLVVEENNLPTQVSTLRKLLGAAAIATIPGCGYRFTLAETPAPGTRAAAPADHAGGIAGGFAGPSAGARAGTHADLQPDSSDADAALDSPSAALAQAVIAAADKIAHQTNLRAAPDVLFGRDDDVDALARLAASHRLVSIVGPGGMGKTSLAERAAQRQLGAFANGVWWVNLAALDAGAKLGLAIAQAAGLQLADDASLAALVQAIKPRQMLLVLDNCEHLLDDVSQVVQALLQDAPGLHVLATSQDRLRVAGEHVYRLGPLAIPPLGAALEDARLFGAFELLEQRASAVDHRYSVPRGQVDLAIGLCRQLDGNPLALEMAGSRLAMLGLPTLADDLGRSLRMLKQTNRQAPARQRTLLATLEWSHALLSDDEQAVLRCLAVFAGRFGLDAAVQVATTSGLADWEVLEALSSLADRSLLQVERGDTPRYRLLQTTRMFARERLAASQQADEAQRQHGLAMQRVAAELEESYWRTPDAAWLDAAMLSYPDLEVAFERAVRVGQAEAGAVILDALFRIDELQASFLAIRHRAAAALPLLAIADDVARARIQLRLSYPWMAAPPGFDRTVAALQAADHFGSTGDQVRQYQALAFASTLLAGAGDLEAGRRAIARAQAIEDPRWPPRLRWLGAVYDGRFQAFAADPAATRASCRLQLDLATKAGSPCQAANARVNLADAAMIAGDWREAIDLCLVTLDELRPLNLPTLTATTALNLFASYLRVGDRPAALLAARRALGPCWQHEMYGYYTAHACLQAADAGQHELAAQLLGYTDHWSRTTQRALEINEAAAVHLAESAVAATLPAHRLDTLRLLGASRSPPEIWTLLQELLAEPETVRA